MRIVSEEDKILEIGAGSGKFVKELQDKGYRIKGMNPCINNEYVEEGSLHNLKNSDVNRYDKLLFIETLQHIDEFPRIIENLNLNIDSEIIIFERLGSLIAKVYKGLSILMGQWMYKWDSPFKKKWLSMHEWKTTAKSMGYKVKKMKLMPSSGVKNKLLMPRVLIILKKI